MCRLAKTKTLRERMSISQLGAHEWLMYLARLAGMLPSIIVALPVQKRYLPLLVYCSFLGTLRPVYSIMQALRGMGAWANTPLPARDRFTRKAKLPGVKWCLTFLRIRKHHARLSLTG